MDYILRTISNTAIVEAKRESQLFDLGRRGEPQKLLLSSIYLSTGTAGAAVQQVKDYAQDFGVGLAVATNGAQWIIFLASRTDGTAVSKGTA